MSNPKVSIVIPVYNGSNYLKEAIDSALAQDYGNYEIIVVNDGSNDHGETEKIALSYGDKIRYFKKENGGVATALNFAIEKAEGEYVSWLSHDDAYFSNKLSCQVNFLKSLGYPERAILSANVEIIDGKSRHIQNLNLHYRAENILYDLLVESIISWCTLLIPKEAFTEVGWFNPEFKTTQDYHLWFRFIHAGYQFRHVDEILVKSRNHPNQDSQTKILLALSERKELESFVLKTFPKEAFVSWNESNQNSNIILLKIKFILFWKKIVPYGMVITKKLGIYQFLSPLWRKYILWK